MPPRVSFSGALGVSLAAIALTAVFVLVMVPPLIIAAFGPGTGASEPGERLSKLVARHDDAAKDSQERFNGRSPFFRPPPKFVPPPVTDAPKVELPKPDLGPPPPPANYTGPSLIASMTDQAWFKAPTTNEKALYLNVGEERSGVKLLSTNPPWSAKVAHKGGEYDVTLFPKTYEKHFTASGPKLRNVIPGLIIQAPPMSGAAASPAVDPAANDAAIEARRLRATPLEKSDAVDPNAPAAQEQADDSAEDEDGNESGEEAGEEEPQGEDAEPQTPSEPETPEEEPESGADAVVNAQATLTGERTPAGSGPVGAPIDPRAPGMPK